MPPRTVKRGGAASGTRRTPRTTKKTQTQQQEASPVVEEPVKAGDMAQDAVVIEEAKPTIEDKPVEAKPVIDEKRAEEERSEPQIIAANGSALVTKEDGLKESVEDYERDERLDLEDNDPEYEPEEYDDKDMEQEDVDEAGLHGEPQHEDQLVEEELEEEETDIAEELDEGQEELEAEEEEEEDDRHDHAAEDGVPEHDEVDVEAEHHEVFKERRKRKEFEVFVGGLDNNATEDDLKKVFSAVGEVTEVRLMMNSQTKRNKGFAFLRFATIEQAKRAVAELKHPVINGKECGVAPSQDSDTLFLGNICKTWTKEALREKLKHYGVDNIDDVTLVEDSNSEGMNRGFAFLEFSSRADAKDAFKRLQKRDISFGVDRPAKVSFADSFIDPGDEIMAQVKTVFIDSLPASWDEDRVRELLKKYGTIEKIELARNMQQAKRRDFGFVTFDTHEAAVVCAKSINNAELGDGDSKAKVRARLSRPLQRGKGKHASRGDMRSSRVSRVPGGSYRRPPPPPARSYPSRPMRSIGSRMPSNILRRPVAVRERRLVPAPPPRARPLPPPTRYYDRRPPVPSYPKSSMKRDYARREEMPPPRSRAPPVDYGPRAMPERRVSYREEYQSRGSGYADMPRSAPRSMARREYPDDGYDHRFDRSTSYREGRARDYDSVSGSKRPYSTMDDVPPRYADPGPRQSRARLDYDIGSSHQYSDGYGDRMGRSNMYSGSRSSMNSQDSHGMYSSRSMGYSGGSYSSGDVGGMYSSSYGSDYIPRGSNGGSGSYSSSMYSSRGAGGSNSSYMGPGGSGSYY